jgi:hypothetical protein
MSDAAVEFLIENSKLDLPQSYLSFLRANGEVEGGLSIEPGWFRIWAANDVWQANLDYRICELLPGYLAFGSNSGSGLFLFDTRPPHPWKIFIIDANSMEEVDVLFVAENFDAFVAAFEK